jgi:PKD repeat protein
MTLDGGLGGIVTNQKNIFLQSNTTERIVLAQSFDGNGFWLITSIRNSNQFVVFKITSAGINPVPVISSVGLINSTTPQTNGDETMGQLKINPQNNKLAVALYGGNKIQISDFDNCNGVISNSTVINTGFNPYGLEFSPNGSKLYYSQYNEAFFTGQVFQLNLTASNIQSSNQLVGNSSSINFQCVGSLQLAPDNKIYIAINGESWLSAINFPDNSANTCGFVDMAVNLISPGIFPTPCYFGLPPKILSLAPPGFVDNSLTFSSLCQQDTIEIELLNLSNVLSVNWNFGDPNSGINNFSTNIIANHNFTSNGTFFISAEVVTNCGVFNYDSIINVVNCSQSNITGIKINGDTCDANNPIDFQALGTSSSPFFFWNFGDPASGTNDTITITGASSVPFPSHLFSSPGVYTICVSFQEPGSALETICRTVNIGLCCNAIVIANDSCVENSVTFSFNSVATINSLIWNFDDVQSGINNNSNLLSPSHIFSNAGNYNVTLTINATCGVFTVNFPISIIDCSNTSNCTGLIEINNNCFEAPSLFEIISADTIFSVLWNFGDTASGINNISTNLIGEHLFTATGSFTINATVFTSCDTFLINTSIIIINCEEPTCTA